MSVLDRYVVKEVLKGTFLALLILYTLLNLFTLRDELKATGVGDYDTAHVFMYLGLMIPHYIYELMPSAALLGSLFVLGNMANHRELVAMRVSGVSIFGIVRSVMLAGLVLTTFSFFIGEFIGPPLEEKAKILKSVAKTQRPVASLGNGLWLRDGNQFIHIKDIFTEGHVANISIYELGDNWRGLKKITYAQQGTFLGAGKWQLKDVKISDVSRSQVIAKQLSKLYWSSVIDSDVVNVVVLDPENIGLYNLYKYISFLQENKQDTAKYALAFWARLVNPFVTLVMLLVAVPFIFGVGRGVALGPRMMMGVLIGMSFNIVDNTAGQMGIVYGLNPFLVAVLPSSLVLLGALYAINRLR